MTHRTTGAYVPPADTPPDGVPTDPPTDPTPVDERPPYGAPGRWRTRLVVGILLALLVLLAVAVVAVLFRAVRHVRRAMHFTAPLLPEEVIVVPQPDRPYAGLRYRVEFYDGNYPQLTDRNLSIAIDLDAPGVDAALDRLARRLAAEVGQLDGQICERPRVVLTDAFGERVAEWMVRA